MPLDTDQVQRFEERSIYQILVPAFGAAVHAGNYCEDEYSE